MVINNDLANVINDTLLAVAKDVPVINSGELSALRAQLPQVNRTVLLYLKCLYLMLLNI
jgi:hypothetical protein